MTSITREQLASMLRDVNLGLEEGLRGIDEGVANSILVKPDTLEYKFKVQNNGKIVDAQYKGVVPDTFKDRPGEEAEVVLKGKLTSQGFHVDSNGIMAKCPSKYDPAKKVG